MTLVDRLAPRLPPPAPKACSPATSTRASMKTARCAKPRYWSRSPTALNPACCSRRAMTICATMEARSPSPAGVSTRARTPAEAALREAWEELSLDPAQVRADRRGRPLSHRHRLRRDPGRRHRPARPRPHPQRGRSRRLVRSPARLPSRPRQSCQRSTCSTRAACAIISKSSGTAAASGARPRRCSSTCRGASRETRSQPAGSTAPGSSGC